jgi:hypothetical protein
MNWKQIDQYHIKSGQWSIAKSNDPEGKLVYHYQLFFRSNSCGFFKTSDEAKQQAEFLEVTQA